MKRNLYEDLIAWKNSNTRKPLILEGARQVEKLGFLQNLGKMNTKIWYTLTVTIIHL